MKTKLPKIFVMLTVLGMVIPHAALAQIQINTNSETSAEYELQGETDTTESNANGSIIADTNVSAGVDANSDTESNTDSEGELRLGTSTMTSADVNTEADLQMFVQDWETNNSAIADVDVQTQEGETVILVRHNHDARLFGFMPVTIESETEVHTTSNGEVRTDVRFPWWISLTSRNDINETELESKINARVQAYAQVTPTSQVHAQVIEGIHSEMTSSTQIGA